MKKNKVYAMYKGEDILGIGSLEELAEILNITIETVKFYRTPTYKKRAKKGKNRRVLIEI